MTLLQVLQSKQNYIVNRSVIKNVYLENQEIRNPTLDTCARHCYPLNSLSGDQCPVSVLNGTVDTHTNQVVDLDPDTHGCALI
jgi:hypothetical protein